MKNKRQEKIKELIENNVIVTQDELQYLLNSQGFNVTQSTVSRIYRYIYPKNGKIAPDNANNEHYLEVFGKGAYDIRYAMNNIVIKCYTGMASSTCVVLDTLFGDKIIGSIAGDDTIIAITADEASAKELTEELTEIIK